MANYSSSDPNEDLGDQIDRLNQALISVFEVMDSQMMPAESPRTSLNSSRIESASNVSENVSNLEIELDSIFQDLDRQKMIAEDWRSHELRKSEDFKRNTRPLCPQVQDLYCKLENSLRSSGSIPAFAPDYKVEYLQDKLNELQGERQDDKTQLKVARLKNKLTALRGEKAINDYLKTSNDIESKVSALDKEESVYSRRKTLFKRLSKKTGVNYVDKYCKNNVEENKHSKVSVQRKFNEKKLADFGKNDINAHYEYVKKLLESKRKVLSEKEDILRKQRNNFLLMWNADPLYGNLAELLRLNIQKYDDTYDKLLQEQETLEQEKYNISKQKVKINKKYKMFMEMFEKERNLIFEERQKLDGLKKDIREILPSIQNI